MALTLPGVDEHLHKIILLVYYLGRGRYNLWLNYFATLNIETTQLDISIITEIIKKNAIIVPSIVPISTPITIEINGGMLRNMTDEILRYVRQSAPFEGLRWKVTHPMYSYSGYLIYEPKVDWL